MGGGQVVANHLAAFLLDALKGGRSCVVRVDCSARHSASGAGRFENLVSKRDLVDLLASAKERVCFVRPGTIHDAPRIELSIVDSFRPTCGVWRMRVNVRATSCLMSKRDSCGEVMGGPFGLRAGGG